MAGAVNDGAMMTDLIQSDRNRCRLDSDDDQWRETEGRSIRRRACSTPAHRTPDRTEILSRETKTGIADSNAVVRDKRRRQYLFNKRRSIQVGFILGDVDVLMIGDVDRITEVRFGG